MGGRVIGRESLTEKEEKSGTNMRCLLLRQNVPTIGTWTMREWSHMTSEAREA